MYILISLKTRLFIVSDLVTIPTTTKAPTVAMIVNTSDGKLALSWVSIKLPAQEPI